MLENTVAIKGIKDGLLVSVSPTEEWAIITTQLAERIDQQSSFYSGARVTLDLGERPVRKDELGSMKALLERRGLTLWSVISASRTTLDAAGALDLRTEATNPVSGRPVDDRATQIPDDDSTYGIMIRRTLRSGRSIRSEGHVLVYGDVNPGAEIIAVGDIIVWGRLRGNVHAGADGDERAVVCALDMIPTQLRIAGHITTSPHDKRRKPRPEIALVRDQRIVVEVWK